MLIFHKQFVTENYKIKERQIQRIYNYNCMKVLENY